MSIIIICHIFTISVTISFMHTLHKIIIYMHTLHNSVIAGMASSGAWNGPRIRIWRRVCC
jgi:hypothetical protein